MAQPVVGEIEMHSVANIATLQTPLVIFFPSKKAPKLCRASYCCPSAHTPLSLCVCSVSVQRVHTSLSLSMLSFGSARGREEQRFNSVKHRYFVACLSNFTCKYSRNHSTAIVFILCLISEDDSSIIRIFVQINILEGAGCVALS